MRDTVKRIGIRELRQQASVWLRQVEAGETFGITDRGRLIAYLIPARHRSRVEELIARGEVTPPEGELLDLGPPLPADPDLPTLSAILADLRADER